MVRVDLFFFLGSLGLGWLGLGLGWVCSPECLLRCRSRFEINKLIMRTHCLTNHKL